MNREGKTTETELDRRESESTEETIGEAVGGVGGALVGGGIGSAAGPVGTVIGAIAGAVGGWWAGEKAGRAVEDMNEDDDTFYRDHYTSSDSTVDEYDEARVGYVVGHAAGRNPGYRDRSFEEIEADLHHGFERDEDEEEWVYEYEEMRPYLRAGYDRGQSL